MTSKGVLLGALLGTVVGCGQMLDLGSNCDNPDPGHLGPDEVPDPCHEEDLKCTGECVPKAPLNWDGPALLWMGVEADAPACPEKAPVTGYTGWADPTGLPADCPTCACDPPTGKCVLPDHVDVFNTKKCAGVPVMSFDAPTNWDGTCTDANAIPKGQLCNGLPCVQSIQIEAPKVEAICAPAAPPPPHPPARESDWGQFARACVGEVVAPCPSQGEVCVPTSAPPPKGFQQCISREGEGGDRECPIEYPHLHVFYDGKTDTRACSPCACSDPTGGVCSVEFAAYGAAQCGPPVWFGHPVSTDPPYCTDIPSGAALAGKSAKVESVTLGICTSSGGKPTGTLVPTNPMTFCCR